MVKVIQTGDLPLNVQAGLSGWCSNEFDDRLEDLLRDLDVVTNTGKSSSPDSEQPVKVDRRRKRKLTPDKTAQLRELIKNSKSKQNRK